MSALAHALAGGAILVGRLGPEEVRLPEGDSIITVTLVEQADSNETQSEKQIVREAFAAPPVIAPVVIPALVRAPEPEPIPPAPAEPPIEVPKPVVKPEPTAVTAIQPPPVSAAPIAATPKPLADPKSEPSREPNDAFQEEVRATQTKSVTAPVQMKAGTRARTSYRKNPEPGYPLAAKRRGQEGTVLLAVRVTEDGRPVRVEIKRSSGFPLLDEAARRAVSAWEFEPARVNSKGIESEVEVPVNFKLIK